MTDQDCIRNAAVSSLHEGQLYFTDRSTGGLLLLKLILAHGFSMDLTEGCRQEKFIIGTCGVR